MNDMQRKLYMKRAAILIGALLMIGPAAYADADQKTKKKPQASCATQKAQTEKVTFLGVYISKVGPSLAHQLGFPKGFYLAVQQVQPGSPAAEAGLQTHDVLLKVDNQILINPEQLRELIRSKDSGHTVGLTYVRSGEEHTTTAKLVTQDLPKVAAAKVPDFRPNHLQPRIAPLRGLSFGGSGLNLEEDVRKQLREHGIDLEKLLKKGQTHTFSFNLPGNAGGSIVVGRDDKRTPGANSSTTVEVNSNLHFNINDDHGSLSLIMKDGKGDLEIKDNNGKSLYKGTYKPGQKIEKLPGHWQKRLRELDSRCQQHSGKVAPRRNKNSQKKEK